MKPYEPLPRFFVEDLPQENALGELPDESSAAAKARRVRPEDMIELVDGRGGIVRAKVGDIKKRSVTYLAVHRRHVEKPKTSISLIQSIPKMDRAEWILQKTTELGVDRIFFAHTDHSVPVKSAAILERWQRIAIEALRQCGRAYLPTISLFDALDPALDALPSGGFRILCNETEDRKTLVDVLTSRSPKPTELWLAVGPEGGWSTPEIQKFMKKSFYSASLGDNVLRVETAAMVSVAIAAALCYN